MLFAAIGGATGELLEQNAQALTQISANIANFQVTCILYSIFLELNLHNISILIIPVINLILKLYCL